MSGLTVFSVIRNGIQNGYPFVEAYASWFDYCDRIVVVEGDSEDGTAHVLDELARLSPKLELVSRPWRPGGGSGEAIAEQTDVALSIAAEGSDRLMYVQADEVYTDAQRALARDWRGGALEFRGCVNFWNSLDRVLARDFPMRYVRLMSADAAGPSLGDGFSFEVDERLVQRSDERILHYGWCFPVNVLQKHVNHAALYPRQPAYRIRGALARALLAQGRFGRRELDALAPEYKSVPFTGEHPPCMRHLVGRRTYDPYLGLELLAEGARW